MVAEDGEVVGQGVVAAAVGDNSRDADEYGGERMTSPMMTIMAILGSIYCFKYTPTYTRCQHRRAILENYSDFSG
ncbi:hypothetical protein JMUB6875_03230 [Nocardia sp. JMUB6875]